MFLPTPIQICQQILLTLPSNPGSNHDSFHPVWYKPSISLATITAIASWSPCFHPSALHLFSQDSWSDSLKKEVQKKKRKFKPSSSSHLIQSKSHRSTLSHVRLSCLFHFKPYWPPCCFLNIAGVLGACTWGPFQWLFPSAWTAPFLQISTWLTHSFLQVFVQKSPLWNLLTTPV